MLAYVSAILAFCGFVWEAPYYNNLKIHTYPYGEYLNNLQVLLLGTRSY